jgi:hypothetical protein
MSFVSVVRTCNYVLVNDVNVQCTRWVDNFHLDAGNVSRETYSLDPDEHMVWKSSMGCS